MLRGRGHAAFGQAVQPVAADALRIPGPRRRGPLRRQPVRCGPQFDLVPTRTNGQPAFRASAPPDRHPPRDRPACPHRPRWPDLREGPVRQQRAPNLRTAAIAPKPITQRRSHRDNEITFEHVTGHQNRPINERIVVLHRIFTVATCAHLTSTMVLSAWLKEEGGDQQDCGCAQYIAWWRWVHDVGQGWRASPQQLCTPCWCRLRWWCLYGVDPWVTRRFMISCGASGSMPMSRRAFQVRTALVTRANTASVRTWWDR